MVETGATDDPTHGIRKLRIWQFLVIVVLYLAIIQGVGAVAGNAVKLPDGKLLTTKQVAVNYLIPLGVALVFVYAVVAWLGWWRPVFHEHKPVQRWVRIVPIVFIVAIAVGINYPQLADKSIGFTLALLLATQFVGWGEEGMFRGVGVTTLRINGLTEGKVALWSSLIFGAVHLSNTLGRGTGAIPQAIIVSLAGYFFYLTRRVSRGNVLNSVLHGLFDFTIISTAGITLKTTIYTGAAAPILVYIVLLIVLLVRRHHIEPATS